MYLEYWQLDRRPFDSTDETAFYYPSEIHQGALLKLRYAIESRSGAAVLSGASGSGKSLLARRLLKQLGDEASPAVHLVFPRMEPTELLAYVAEELTGKPCTGSNDQIVRRLQRFLIENAAAGEHAVLVIDEAHLLLDTGTLEILRLLLNFEHAGQPALSLVLIGQPQLLVALERLPSLEQRASAKCMLRALSDEETMSYVNHRLQAAGAKQEIFTQAALTLAHELTRGAPRSINRLCDLALLVGFAQQQDVIGPEELELVSDELLAGGLR